MKIIADDYANKTANYGIYHFSNEGKASWFDFADKIFKSNKVTIEVKPIPTSQFPTPAKRPAFSVLDKSKIKSTFEIEIDDWETALNKKRK
jgi:dTDP-4-dehydrorhamnose reductase